MTKARFRFWLLTGLNILAVATLLLFLLEDYPATRGLVSGGLLVLLIVFLFFLIPLALVAVFLLGRRPAATPTRRQKIYTRVSCGILCLSWLVFAFPALFWSAVFVAAKEPWPLSLRQGPDSDRGKAGFEKLFGFAAEGAVTELYFYSFDLRDAAYYVRFRYDDPDVIVRISAARDLVSLPLEAREDARFDLRAHRDRFSWWTPAQINAADSLYVDRPTAEKVAGTRPGKDPVGAAAVLWVDSQNGRAYYREIEF